MNGRCKFGDRCKFEHPSSVAQNRLHVGKTAHTHEIPNACVHSLYQCHIILNDCCLFYIYRIWEVPKAPRRPLLLAKTVRTTQCKRCVCRAACERAVERLASTSAICDTTVRRPAVLYRHMCMGMHMVLTDCHGCLSILL